MVLYLNMEDFSKILYIVATPIGNLEDITHRAIRILNEVDIILCEDTRVTRKLLNHYGIKTKVDSYHAHSNKVKETKILDNINKGTVYALVSDAGTPTISDPGVKLIHEAYKRFRDKIDIVSIPGASAVITALSATGFIGNQFTFYGFMPHKKGRQKIFKEIFNSNKISLFYESPHRIIKTLDFIKNNYPSPRKVCIARELTKIYEQKIIGDIEYVYDYFKNNPDKIKGEFVVIVDAK